MHREQEELSRTVDSVMAELMVALDAGEDVDVEAWLRRYPQFADELREFFAMHEQLSGFRPDKPDSNRDDLRDEQVTSSLTNSPPRSLGDYDILEEINRGGMGIVYKAKHRTLGRVVALKLIRSGEMASAEEVERFQSEAEAAAALNHPGIVPIYDVGMYNGLVYYTMAFIEGHSLAELVEHGPVDPIEAARIVYKLCLAVQFAHEQGVFHRDLKPANILVNKEGQPVIIDFGLAKMIHRDTDLTHTGQILGTPAYIPPEAATGGGKASGMASDVYALGAILYCLCAGQAPFTGPTPFDVLLQVLDVSPPPPSHINRRVNRSLDYICLKALEKDPEARYQSAGELAEDLQHVLTGQPINRPHVSFVQRMHNWWQRAPILVAHVMAIGLSAIIVTIAYFVKSYAATRFPLRMSVLASWLVISFLLQVWVYRARWRDVAIISWLAIDVIILTGMIWLAAPPRSLLLIGYPLMTVASSLFYRRRFVTVTTALSVAGFLFLNWQCADQDFVRRDFSAIFITGMMIIWLCLITMIHRMRGLSRFYEGGLPNA
ncbi:MAG: protein kinase [Pirellulaceae bacterium]|nr:MAG: protein kinase [Pirellulaceae bacterium]